MPRTTASKPSKARAIAAAKPPAPAAAAPKKGKVSSSKRALKKKNKDLSDDEDRSSDDESCSDKDKSGSDSEGSDEDCGESGSDKDSDCSSSGSDDDADCASEKTGEHHRRHRRDRCPAPSFREIFHCGGRRHKKDKDHHKDRRMNAWVLAIAALLVALGVAFWPSSTTMTIPLRGTNECFVAVGGGESFSGAFKDGECGKPASLLDVSEGADRSLKISPATAPSLCLVNSLTGYSFSKCAMAKASDLPKKGPHGCIMFNGMCLGSPTATVTDFIPGVGGRATTYVCDKNMDAAKGFAYLQRASLW